MRSGMSFDYVMQKFGMPVYVSDHMPDNGKVIVACDPAGPPGATTLFVPTGSVLGDRIQYGWEDGHLKGPLIRYERYAEQQDRKARAMIAEAFSKADLAIAALQLKMKEG